MVASRSTSRSTQIPVDVSHGLIGASPAPVRWHPNVGLRDVHLRTNLAQNLLGTVLRPVLVMASEGGHEGCVGVGVVSVVSCLHCERQRVK